jgi:hypothetical protein
MAVQIEDGRLTEKGRLLRQLQIDPAHREDRPTPHRGRWIAGSILLTLTLATGGAAAFLLLGGHFEVDTPLAAPAEGASTAVLQATGYVTACRPATGSAQITGTLTDVLIEDGEQV